MYSSSLLTLDHVPYEILPCPLLTRQVLFTRGCLAQDVCHRRLAILFAYPHTDADFHACRVHGLESKYVSLFSLLRSSTSRGKRYRTISGNGRVRVHVFPTGLVLVLEIELSVLIDTI